jgi:hypothetical protein
MAIGIGFAARKKWEEEQAALDQAQPAAAPAEETMARGALDPLWGLVENAIGALGSMPDTLFGVPGVRAPESKLTDPLALQRERDRELPADMVRNLGKGVVGAGEAALTLGSGLGSAVAAGVAAPIMEAQARGPSASPGARMMQKPFAEAATERMGRIQKPITYLPQTEAGQRATVGALDALAYVPTKAGGAAGNLPFIGPAAQTLAETFLDPLEALPGGVAFKAGSDALRDAARVTRGALEGPLTREAVLGNPTNYTEVALRSGAAEAINAIPMKKGTPEQWAQQIDALQKKGVIKAEELNYSGLMDRLKGNIAPEGAALSPQGDLFNGPAVGALDDAGAGAPRVLTKAEVVSMLGETPKVQGITTGENYSRDLLSPPQAPRPPRARSIADQLDETTGAYYIDDGGSVEYFESESEMYDRVQELRDEAAENDWSEVESEVEARRDDLKERLETEQREQYSVEEDTDEDGNTVYKLLDGDGDEVDTFESESDAEAAIDSYVDVDIDDYISSMRPQERRKYDTEAARDYFFENYEGGPDNYGENSNFDEDAYNELTETVTPEQTEQYQRALALHEADLKKFNEERATRGEPPAQQEDVLAFRENYKRYTLGGSGEHPSYRARALRTDPEQMRGVLERSMKSEKGVKPNTVYGLGGEPLNNLGDLNAVTATELPQALGGGGNMRGNRVASAISQPSSVRSSSGLRDVTDEMLPSVGEFDSRQGATRSFLIRNADGEPVAQFAPTYEQFASYRGLEGDALNKAVAEDFAATVRGSNAERSEAGVDISPFKRGHIGDEGGKNVFAQSRVASIPTESGDTYFINELQSDWVPEYTDTSPIPFEKSWWKLAFKDNLQQAAARGDASISWPATGEQVNTIQNWPSGYHEDSSKKPIVERYTKDLPKEAEKLGKQYGVKPVKQTLTFPDGSQHEVWTLPINDKMRADFAEKPLPAFNLKGAGALDMGDFARGKARSGTEGALTMRGSRGDERERLRREVNEQEKRRTRGALHQ